MKKYTLLLFTLVFLIGLSGCGSDLPDGYVPQGEIVIDNETPFAATDPETLPFSVTIGDVMNAVNHNDMKYTYLEYAEYCGNKVIRHYTENGADTYYTVYSQTPTSVRYVILLRDDSGVFYIDPDCTQYPAVDSRDTITGIFDYDQPSVILNGKMPDSCYKENYSYDQVNQIVEEKWRLYNTECAMAGLKSDFYYTQLSEDKAELFIRCLQTVSFDGRENGDHGLYVYDISVREDGSGSLRFQHMYLHAYPSYEPPEQDVTVPLSAEVVTSLLNLFDEYDFDNIPTWNPEEFNGFDGETTYILRSDGWNSHLITMWESTEGYGIYHIRCAIEELVKKYIPVTSGRIYA